MTTTFLGRDEDDVLALQNVEGLGRIVVNVQRRSEPGGPVGLQQREAVRRLSGVRSHAHP